METGAQGGITIRPWLPSARQLCRRALPIAFGILVMLPFRAPAAEVDGVQFPDKVRAAGTDLQLNGYGIRTYSFLGIHVYAAALYLEHLSDDPDKIIRSSETKLLTIRFLHDVSADLAREAWREGFTNNCQDPCRLDPNDVQQFLASVPAMRAGDEYSLLFRRHVATVTANGQQIGSIPRAHMAEAMLATFLGPRSGALELKLGLLGGRG